MRKRPAVSAAQLSATIGTIYDCAIDPRGWESALEQVARLVDGSHGMILIFDPVEARVRYSATWNFDPEWMERYNQAYAADDPTRDSFLRFDVGEPFNVPMLLDPRRWLETRYYREFCEPKGWLDSLGVTVMKTASRLVSLAVVRHKDVGFSGPQELESLRLLAPHLRKAVSIADLLEMQRLTAQTFGASFDALRIPIMLVDREGALVHANTAGQEVVASGDRIRLDNGLLRPQAHAAAKRLQTAIAAMAKGPGKDDTEVIFLPGSDGKPTFAYVLPLRFGDVRGRLEPRATAAIFLASGGASHVVPSQAWASAFGLTAAEARVLALLVEGGSIVEVADRLDVAVTTARTHLARLMRKTGSPRQADLVRLALQLALPLGPLRRQS